jgi:phospholipase/lecithinase/hemolysin
MAVDAGGSARVVGGTRIDAKAVQDGLPGLNTNLSNPAALALDLQRRVLYLAQAGAAKISVRSLDNDTVTTAVGSGSTDPSLALPALPLRTNVSMGRYMAPLHLRIVLFCERRRA